MSGRSGNFDDIELIWGVLSGDDLTGAAEPTMYTMNDLSLVYWKDAGLYSVDIETVYEFRTKADEINYLADLLSRLTVWMNGQGRSTQTPLRLEQFFSASGDGRYSSIEEAYTAFRMMVEGYVGRATLFDRRDKARSLFGILPEGEKE